jgi:hypothetical protein
MEHQSMRRRGLGQVAMILAASALALASAVANAGGTVPAAPCANGQAIQVAAQAKSDAAKAQNQAFNQYQDQLQKDAMDCLERIKNFLASSSIRTYDITSGLIDQVEKQLAQKACNVAQAEVQKGMEPVTNLEGKVNNGISNGVGQINNGFDKAIGLPGGPSLISNGVGGGAPVTSAGPVGAGAPTTTPSSTSSSTWDKLSCAFGGSCGNK